MRIYLTCIPLPAPLAAHGGLGLVLDAVQQVPRPDEFGGEDGEADGDDDEGGAGGNEEDEADADDGAADDEDDEAAGLAEEEVHGVCTGWQLSTD